MREIELQFKRLFGSRPKLKSNPPKFLEILPSNLRGLKQIVFALVDKNLAPVAVTLEQYVKDALIHLSDSNTYELFSTQKAKARNTELQAFINKWMVKYARSLDINAQLYLEPKLKATKDDPF